MADERTRILLCQKTEGYEITYTVANVREGCMSNYNYKLQKTQKKEPT